MGWCEANRVDYVFGLARNRRLEAALAVEQDRASIAGQTEGPTGDHTGPDDPSKRVHPQPSEYASKQANF